MEKKSEIRVYAGPNGSGKSTFTQILGAFGEYINADEIKKSLNCTDLEAAQIAQQKREDAINSHIDFSFETVLSTERNLKLLQKAKNKGYFIKGFYVLTKDPQINVHRISSRLLKGGHDVPPEKIVDRYYKALKLLPQFIEICDVVHVYDNSDYYVRIFKKRKTESTIFVNKIWREQEIMKLIGASYDEHNVL